MKKGYHDYTPAVKVKKREPKIYKRGSSSLKILTTIPKKPIGYLTHMGQIIQTTDEKGNVKVDSFVLMFGTQAPKPGASRIFINGATTHASLLLDR
tara:strand:- start:467 stop:754 length:288 start_codon:yes stop_codon:yes gene_type:complete